MEQVSALNERVTLLKRIAASMQEGAIHTRLFPEVDKILALPDNLDAASVSEREAVTRQVREHEQAFDQLGYSLLKQNMPPTGVSSIFQVVQAAEEFKVELGRTVGRRFTLPSGEELTLDYRHRDLLTRHSLSIGTPPVTAQVGDLVGGALLGRPLADLAGFTDFIGCDPTNLEELLALLQRLVDSSLHYCTAAEEREFLDDAGEFVNFEGGRIFNRLVITESPDRVVELIQRHLFDKFGGGEAPPVRLVDEVDGLDGRLIATMQQEPNHIFVARVSRLPHRLFSPAGGDDDRWRGVLGRLVLVDDSSRARASNTTVVYTLFPHVARTLRNIQTRLAGRPANTQLQLRRILEQFSPADLAEIRQAVEGQLRFLWEQDARGLTVEVVRVHEWRRHGLLDYLALVKLRRLLSFLEVLAGGDEGARKEQGSGLARQVSDTWREYFYRGLPADRYRAVVIPGGGRGTLTLIGEYHRAVVREAVDEFRQQHLTGCRERLAEMKRSLKIPNQSTDEIQAAIRQSQLRALSPTQWKNGKPESSLADYLARSMLYRLADGASRATRRTRAELDRASFGNLTGGPAAMIKRAFTGRGLGALHGRLEQVVGAKVGQYDRRVRDSLAPISEVIQTAQRTIDGLKGELDPVAVSEVEAVFELVERGHFYPTLILPELSWTYGDVFPDKDFPEACVIRVPLNDRHELDPLSLMARLEELRYLFRRFPELFELSCRSMLLVLNTPHNPTGVVYRRETILRLLKVASEYGITMVDDNSYHKLVFSEHKAREGEESVAQLFEKHRAHFSRPVRLLTAGATTKGLQGAGDRTGLLCTSDGEAADFVRTRASRPHQLSLFLTRAKLELGQEARAVTGELERIAGQVATGGSAPWDGVRDLLEGLLSRLEEPAFPVPLFEVLLEGYEELLRCRHRGASLRDLSECLSQLTGRVKALRLERRLRADVERRVEQATGALARALPHRETIQPRGAFYCCVRLSEPGDDRGLQAFLTALSRHRKVDLTDAGGGYVRISLGGMLRGDAASYRDLGRALEVYLGILDRSWQRFDEELGRDPARLDELFLDGEDPVAAALSDLAPLLRQESEEDPLPAGLATTPSERGTVYCIEEGRSLADKIFVQTDGEAVAGGERHLPGAEESATSAPRAPCETVEELLESRTFRVIYRRLLRRVYREDPELAELPYEQLENQFGPLCCQAAYHDRQLMDDDLRRIIASLYSVWHSDSTIRVLAARLNTRRQGEKRAALRGVNQKLNELVNELMHAFKVPDANQPCSFDLGLEILPEVEPSPRLPAYLASVVGRCDFAGAVAPLNQSPVYLTGATVRIADYRYGFLRRDGLGGGKASPGIAHFRDRLARFTARFDSRHYLCKAVQVGPFRMLLVTHKSCLHLVCDELRLFPQIEAVSRRDQLELVDWHGVLLFGIPAKVVGDSYKTGYVMDELSDGTPLPTAWVAREDATDYVGFLKKSLLTLHNEQVKALGGMPVHGAMITITFINGLRKTLVFSADSGTGKSETITAMMEQAATGLGVGAELQRIDILAGDMLSLWLGEDGQIYAFGTETGDFLRLTDITESWKARYGDLLKRGSTSNPDHPKNPRVTIPGICDARRVLSPTRVNGFFYINNYQPPRGGAVELSDDPHHVLKDLLVRGLRKNKGTSGDQPNMRAGMAFAGRGDLVTRYRHTIDELLRWESRDVEDGRRTCLVYRDGSNDIFAARQMVTEAFSGQGITDDQGQPFLVQSIDYDLMQNLFWLEARDGRRLLLDRRAYDQVFEPLVSTFCGNPFVDPDGMDRTLDHFAEAMRQALVHTGEIRTQLATPGHEFSGPDRAARDVITFLMEDEEVNARYQRNKEAVARAMQRHYGGVLPPGGNLPVELEGYNLLLLEEFESTSVRLRDPDGRALDLGTPFSGSDLPATRDSGFVPALALPLTLLALRDIEDNPDHRADLHALEVDLSRYKAIRHHNSLEELAYQVLLVNRVLLPGATESEVARMPGEVRKAFHVARLLLAAREETGSG